MKVWSYASLCCFTKRKSHRVYDGGYDLCELSKVKLGNIPMQEEARNAVT
jgi:hypothetical protein